MAIQDDWAIDTTLQTITYTGGFTDGRPTSIYTVNELYTFLQDTFDEPNFLQYPIPMTAQTPTQYTLVNRWFVPSLSTQALYGGSIQTSGYTKSGSVGITAVRWASATSAPTDADDVGKAVAGVTSLATGTIISVDEVRNIVWIRNSSAAQFQDGEVIDDDATGTNPDFTLEATNGFKSGDNVYANLFSVGSLQANTEVYVGQEDDHMGGAAYHTANEHQRRIEKLDEWWDSDVNFTASPNLLGGLGHIDLLVQTTEAGDIIDGGRLAVFARQFGTIYSHFEFVGGVGNFVVPFASTGADLNATDLTTAGQEAPYNALFNNRTGNDLEIGDVLENVGATTPVGRLRAVVTNVTGGASATGDFDYILIGENEADGTLRQLANLDNIGVRGDTTDFDINGAPTQQGPSTAQGTSITFGNFQFDVDEDASDEEFAGQIDCSLERLDVVYRRMMFLASRGNQDGTTPGTPDTLLPSAHSTNDEAGEFYRAVGDITVPWDGKVGTPPAEGTYVTNNGAASGVIVALSNSAGASGQLTLTQVKGTWANNDQVAAPGQHATNRVDINGTPSSIVDNTGAPFGTFAGGRWFVARGLYLTNVPAADANNWQTVDLAGTVKVPPTQRTITFAGLQDNDRAAIIEVVSAGSQAVREDQNTLNAGSGIDATTFDFGSLPLDVPTSGWVRIVDVSDNNRTFRFAYDSINTTTGVVTLETAITGTTTSAGTATVLNDTGAFTVANFGGEGEVRTGMIIKRDDTDAWAIVLRRIDDNSIETTPLSAGTWDNALAWSANAPPIAFTTSDTGYFPFVDDTVDNAAGIGSGSDPYSLAKTIKFVENTPVVARARFSDTDVGGQKILPFELTGQSVTDADLTITAIRTNDDIAS